MELTKKLKGKFRLLTSRAKHDQKHQKVDQPPREQQPKSQKATSSQPGPSGLPERSNRPSRPEPTIADVPIKDLWDLAYENLHKSDKESIDEYEAKLRKNFSATLVSTVGMTPRAARRDRMHKILERKMEEINRDTWKLKFGSSEVQVKDLVQPVLGVVNWANEYVTGAVSANPTASLAWGGVSLLLPLFLNPSKQASALAQGLEHISFLIDQSRMWESLYLRRYESHTSENQQGSQPGDELTIFKDSLQKLYQEILKFLIESYCYYDSNGVTRLGQDMIKWNEWDTMLASIQDRQKKFSDTLSAVNTLWGDSQFDEEQLAATKRHQEALLHWQSIGTDVSGLLDAVKQSKADEARDGLLNWLCQVDASVLYNRAHGKHTNGTSNWLVQGNKEFEAWKKSPSSLLWLHGKPGCGKSVLSSSAIKHLKDRVELDPQTALAYFFFDFRGEQTKKVDIMLSSLIRQLYAERPDKTEPVERLGHLKARGERPDTEKLEAALLSTTIGFSAAFIVIDALDECPTLDGERHKLINTLAHIIQDMPANVHVMCTSRPEPDIAAGMECMLSPSSKSVIDLSNQSHSINHDIELYIDSMFSSPDYHSWTGDLKQEAKAALTGKADGMFQYVQCQFDALQKLPYPTEKIIRGQLRHLPQGLDETYERMLEKADPRILSVLKWLASSTRDLSLGELAEISVFDPETKEPLGKNSRLPAPEACIKPISGLIITEESRGRYPGVHVRLAHFTVKEYLMSERIVKGKAAYFSFTEIEANLHIAHMSLSYQYVHLQNVRDNSIAWEVEFDFPLARYALHSWAPHLEIVPRDKWPADVARLAKLALTMRSDCVRTTTWNGFEDPIYEDIDFLLVRNLFSGDFERPFFYPARSGFTKITEMLLEGGFGTNWYLTQQDIDKTLAEAARGGNIDTVKMLIGKGADPKAQIGTLGGALQAAAFEGHDAIVNLLLDHGASVDAQNGKMGSALQAAILGRHLTVAQLLVRRGADVNAYSVAAGCPLMSAAEGLLPHAAPSGECLEFLLDNGADMNMQCINRGTALQLAAANMGTWGYRECYDLLLKNRADVNIPGGQYGGVLQALCQNEYAKVSDIQLLLDRGVNVNAEGGKYGSALQAVFASSASLEEKTGIVSLLLEKGAKVNMERAPGGYYGTALQSASASYYSFPLVELLLQKGADVKVEGGYYGSALQAACARDPRVDFDTVELLLDWGANVNSTGGEFGCPLQAAALERYGDTDVLELLLDNDADVNKACGRYGNALQASCVSADVDNVRFLLDRDAEINASGGEYGTALQAACAVGSRGITSLLVERGAHIHVQGGKFGSAWHAAAANIRADNEILQLLLKHGAKVNDKQGSQYATALQAALELECNDYRDLPIKRIQFLLDHGADVNIGGGVYGFPLQSACANVYGMKLTIFLLDKCNRIEVNAAGGIFGSALQAAAHSGQIESVRELLKRGAKINARGGKYGSALNAAVLKGFWDIVELLLEKGADPDSRQLPQPDEEWLSNVRSTFFDDQEPWWSEIELQEGVRDERLRERAWDEAGRGAVERYRKFWVETATR
ncbi:hypothetical protein KVR01_012915 [Diaporthe batatas]|uniref:uncharacterized protein n=1 Tax=Diaporthe batatas TaxID=748121 RepID=UPI001D058F2A|nr:uncharacterized protein KVR01_012915 [Diaporthe batatas]KAG8157207.1 hypothetical protein KVR01_012915 [Diaporthe batatas]